MLIRHAEKMIEAGLREKVWFTLTFQIYCLIYQVDWGDHIAAHCQTSLNTQIARYTNQRTCFNEVRSLQ